MDKTGLTEPTMRKLLPAKRPGRAGINAALPLALAFAVAACGSGTSQADLCERVVDKLYGGPGSVTVVKTEKSDGAKPTVAVQFRSSNAASRGAVRTVICQFASNEGDGRLDLTGVRRPDNRPLHQVSVIFLKRQISQEKSK